MRYLAVVTYDGTHYAGWQIQPNGISIEEEIEKVLSRILTMPTKIYGSGRTDAGVHSHGQTFHFDAKEIKDLGKFTYSLNSLLPRDIHINTIKKVNDDFNARYDVKSKTYVYFINMGSYDPFNKDYMYQLLRPLDLSKMEECLEVFKGEHCFMNLTSKDEDQANYVREIYECNLEAKDNIVKITFKGNGFMRYMVRMLVGTLIEVGLARLEVAEVKRILEADERKVVSFKAPACGLYLEKVEY